MSFSPSEERYFAEKMHKIGTEMNKAVQQQFAGVHDHINFTLQQAYFKCAYQCFDRTRSQDEISSCVDSCSFPVQRASRIVENEMAQFQERLQRSLLVCQDKLQVSLPKQKENSVRELDSCINDAVKEHIETLPHVANKVKQALAQDGAVNMNAPF